MNHFAPGVRRGARTLAAGLAPFLTLAAGSAAAHPGHGAEPSFGFFEGLVHLLTEPDHLALLALAVGTAVLVVRHVRAQRRRDRSSHRAGDRR